MLRLTNGPLAPWDVISSENKRHGRVEVIETVIRRMEEGMARWGVSVPSHDAAGEETELALVFDDAEFITEPEGPAAATGGSAGSAGSVGSVGSAGSVGSVDSVPSDERLDA
jgi:hypothetical protein